MSVQNMYATNTAPPNRIGRVRESHDANFAPVMFRLLKCLSEINSLVISDVIIENGNYLLQEYFYHPPRHCVPPLRGGELCLFPGCSPVLLPRRRGPPGPREIEKFRGWNLAVRWGSFIVGCADTSTALCTLKTEH